MIRERCPDGVPFRPLGEVLRIKNGKDHKPLGDGEVPVYGSGGIIRHVDTAAAEGPSVLIPRKGSLANLFYVEGPFWVVDTIFRTEIDTSLVAPKFLFHQLQTMGLGEMNQAGGVPSQTQGVLNRLRIPVPPLEVQQEIVRVLDTFTELEAELEARRVQYAHYRDTLLTFPEGPDVREHCPKSVPFRPLGELATLVRGNGMPKSDFVDEGVGCIHYGQIYTHYGAWATDVISYVAHDKAAKLAQVEPGDLIVTNTSETLEDVGKAVAWLGQETIVTGGHATVVKPSIDPKYLAYWFQSPAFFAEKRRRAIGTKVIDVSARQLAEVLIPVPPLEVQQEIAGTLDRFDALVNSLTDGLPAEIAARRQQYEHYRDKLLTFEELAS
ncbi:MAG: restriction endonuclease subunit S [Thermoleophilia bacterium]|nr:restriction endonuclease subunit S [Thermoleophilia bacterium]